MVVKHCPNIPAELEGSLLEIFRESVLLNVGVFDYDGLFTCS